MSDRELLELAAKAAGLTYDEQWGYIAPGSKLRSTREWNPLANDGDALRLAVKLHIDLEIYGCHVEAIWVDMDRSETHCTNEDWGAGEEDDDVKVRYVRRAIVRAAAEIGRTMP